MPVRSRSRTSISRILPLPPSDSSLSSSSSREKPRRTKPPSRHCAGGSSASVRAISAATSPQSPSSVAGSSSSSGMRQPRRGVEAVEGRVDERAHLGQLAEAARQRHQVARRGHAERRAPGEPLEVVDLGQRQPSSARSAACSTSHSIASCRRRTCATSRSGAASQRRSRRPPIDVLVSSSDAEQRALLLAADERHEQLEVGPRRLVEHQVLRRLVRHELRSAAARPPFARRPPARATGRLPRRSPSRRRT